MKISDLEIMIIEGYRKTSHPLYVLLHKMNINLLGCRYEPSCSEYSQQAIKKYGAPKGTLLAMKRIARCRPPYGGHDPVN